MSAARKIFSKDGSPMVSARKAAQRLHCAPDYIGKLCREGRLKGSLTNGAWFVELGSIAEFEIGRRAAAAARAKELAQERKEEALSYQYKNGGVLARARMRARSIIPKGTIAALGASALIGLSLAFASAAVSDRGLGAAIAQINSPFFGPRIQTISLERASSGVSKIFDRLYALIDISIFQNYETPLAQTPPASQGDTLKSPGVKVSPLSSTARPTTIVQNNYPVIERTMERTRVVEKVSSGVSEDLLTQKLQELGNALRAELYAGISNVQAPSGFPSSGGVANNITITQVIDKLDNVLLTGATVHGLSGLSDSDVPDEITASNYLPLAGGALTGAVTNSAGATSTFSGPFAASVLDISTTTATSTFANGIQLTGGCFRLPDGTCAGSGGASVTGGTAGMLTAWTNSTALTATSGPTAGYFVATSSTASILPFASTTGITVAGTASTTALNISGISSCSGGNALTTNSSGVVSCGAITASGGTFPFVPADNYGANANSTSTALWLQAGVQASSTSHFANADFVAATSTSINATVLGLGGTNYFTSLTGSGLSNSSGSLTCTTSTASAFGCLAAADWSLFNNKISSTSIDTSAELAALIGDETGSGALVFGTSPNITTPTISGLGSHTLLTLGANGVLTGTSTPSASYFIATSSTASILPFASTTGITVSGTASTTNLRISGTQTLENLASGGLAVNASGQIYKAATTTFSTGLTYSNGNTTCDSANSTTFGCLAAADWTLFNNKISSTSLSQIFPFTPTAYGNSTSTLLQLNGGASTTLASINDVLYVGRTATTTIRGDGVASVIPFASSTALTVSGSLYGAGLSTCNTTVDKLLWNNGSFSCGADQNTGGAGSEINWTWFNGSGIRLGTTTNQVAIGATATSTLAKVEVTPNGTNPAAIFFGAIGVGTSSPGTPLSVAGAGVFSGTVTASTFFATSTEVASTFPFASSTALTVSGTGYFGTASTSNLTVSNIQNALLKAGSNGVVVAAVAGTDYAPGNVSFPFTPTALGNSTSTLLQLNAGLIALASSTIGNGAQAGGLTISGGATTTGNLIAQGALNVSGDTTLANATSTNLAVTGVASALLKTNSLGSVIGAVLGTDYVNFAWPFTSSSNFGTTTSATTTSLHTAGVFFASSTTQSSQLPFASSTALTVSGTGYFGTASTTNLNISSAATFQNLTSGGLAVNASGAVYKAATTTFSTGLTYSNGNTTCDSANSTTFGCLAAADWSLFNNKISSTSIDSSSELASFISDETGTGNLVFGTTPTISDGRLSSTTLSGFNLLSNATTTYLGVTGTATSSFAAGINLTTGCFAVNSTCITGSGGSSGIVNAGTAGQLPYYAAVGSALSATSSLFLATNGNFGIGSSTPSAHLAIDGGSILQAAYGSSTQAGSVATVGHSYNVAVAGRYAYVADFEGGLRILDITHPSKLSLVGSYTGTVTALSVVVAGRYAYVGDNTGISIIDVSNPASPALLGRYGAITFVYTLALSGKYLYAPDFNGGAMRIIDVSNPAAPTLVGSFSLGGSSAPYAVAVLGKYAYVGDQGNSAIYVVDISNPAAPAKTATYSLAGSLPAALYVSGKYLYVADGAKGVYALNVGNPAATPTVSASFDTAGAYYGVAAAGRYVYAADHAGNFVVLDFTASTTLPLVGRYNSGGTPWGLAVSGKYAYMAADQQGLRVIDLAGADLPAAHIGSLESNSANISDTLAVGGDITAGGGLDVGISGIFSRGAIVAAVASTTQTNPVVANFMGGNVGISTSSPYARLSVLANHSEYVNKNLFAIASSTALGTTTLFSILNSGNVGIGVATPTYALDVAGFINTDQYSGYKQAGNTILYASSTLGSVYLGGGAGPSAYNASAAYNTLLGTNAGNLVTSGANNVILGAFSTAALSNLTSGSNNVSIGYNISMPSATANNQLNIQNIIYGAGNAGTAGMPSIGQVGIGSTTPYARLGIHANAGDTNQTLFAIASSTATATTTLFTIDNTGKVGIASTSPVARLSIQGSDNSATTKGVVITDSFASELLTVFNNGLTKLQNLLVTASSTVGSGTQAGGLTISGGATTTGFLTVQGNATSTFAAGLQSTALNITSTSATSTFANGIKLNNTGCLEFPGGSALCSSNPASVTLTQVVTASTAQSNTAFTVPTNTAYIVVETWGGGGGGGGGGAGGSTGGGGGGSGGYSKKIISSPSGTYYYTVGAGGAGGGVGANGTVGNQSCFGTNGTACTSPSVQANGGGAGGLGGGTSGIGGSNAAAGTGDVTIQGSNGSPGSPIGDGATAGSGGNGGTAPAGGGGGAGGRANSGDGGGNGSAYGGGGGGTGANPASNVGGSGGAGGVTIYVYTTSQLTSSGAGVTLTRVVTDSASSTSMAVAYTPPSNISYIEVEVWGGGGGGSYGVSTAGATDAKDGNSSCFGTNSSNACTSATISATGGSHAIFGQEAGGGGGGGSGGDVNLTGGGGTGASIGYYSGNGFAYSSGGTGGSAPLGGGGAPAAGNNVDGLNGSAYGGGGSGGGVSGQASGSAAGGGGGGGGYAKKIITAPSGTYYYNVGAGGTRGTGPSNGGNGGAGGIVIKEYTTGAATAGSVGSATSAGWLPYYAASGSNLTATSSLYLTTSGNFGIGTTPSDLLHIRKDQAATTTLQIENQSTDAAGRAGLKFTTPAGSWTQLQRRTSGHMDFAFDGSDKVTFLSTGNVGIGTTSPASLFSAAGNGYFTGHLGVGIANPSTNRQLELGKSGSDTSVGARFNDGATGIGLIQEASATFLMQQDSGGVYLATGATAWTPNSDVRLKENIESLSATSGLAAIMQLRPVTFNWKDAAQNAAAGEQLGFIAQEVQSVFPELISHHPTTTITLADGTKEEITGTLGLNYQNLIVPAIAAIQQLNGKVDENASSTMEMFAALDLNLETIAPTGSTSSPQATASSTPAATAFADKFFSNLFARVTNWLADAGNGIAAIFATEVHAETVYAKKLCLEEVCITKTELQKMLDAANGLATTSITSAIGTTDTTGNTSFDSAQDKEPPVITINGANPAHLLVGDSYADLGASVTDNFDNNLGIKASVDPSTGSRPTSETAEGTAGQVAGEWVEIGNIKIDTTAAGEHAIIYRATDAAGNVGKATRTVIVEEGSQASPEPAPEPAPSEPTVSEPVIAEPAPAPEPAPALESPPPPADAPAGE